ncbi:MAG: putative ATPase [Candidatus Saccharibacteria bacterium]|nr:putative ATPase [Candidatus Saccharibacteria bacterium]
MKENIRKRNILNLIKYHAENNDPGFRTEAYDIARYFDRVGDPQLAEYIMALLSGTNTFVPQTSEHSLPFFKKVTLSGDSLPLPTPIKNDIMGVINSITHNAGINKFLFQGEPGTGKTETAKQIARILERELYLVDFDGVVDSKLGQTTKNIGEVFQQINDVPNPDSVVILLDEIDSIALDRVNSNDIREMGRATSSVLKALDNLDARVVLIATTNLYKEFDKALARRFDSTINFNRYKREDLIEVAETILNELLVKFKSAGRNMRLFKKIISGIGDMPYPGDLKNVIKTSLAFSDPTSEYDYLKKLYENVHPVGGDIDLSTLKKDGFTVREIEILTGKSKSQVSRDLQA